MGFSVGVLSWRAHKTLVKTLSTYAALRDMADEAVVFFNEISDEDRAIADRFGFAAAGCAENLGILGGTLGLVRALKGDKILLLQNDNPVNVADGILRRRLEQAQRLLDSGEADMVRLRDRFDPSFSDRKKYLGYFPGGDGKDTLLLKTKRFLRPLKARRMAGRAPAAGERPDIVHPDIFEKNGECFMADSRFVNYSDQPFMAKRSFELRLLEWADGRKARARTLNSKPVPEIIINSRFWRKARYRIAVSEGVCAHARYDDSFRTGHPAFNADISTSRGRE